MSVALYMDHHVPSAITRGLRQRGVNVRTAEEDGCAEVDDEFILAQGIRLGRFIYTNDHGFLAIAHRWLAADRDFAGLGYAHPLRISVRQAIESLEIIAKASDLSDLRNAIFYLPF